MGELVNLRHVRKKQRKIQADKQAEVNRATFGRTKSQRENEAAEAARATNVLDQHRLAREDGT